MGQDGRVHLHLKQNVQSLTSHYVSLSVATGIVGGIFLDCANLDCANIHYLIQNEAIPKKSMFYCFTVWLSIRQGQ